MLQLGAGSLTHTSDAVVYVSDVVCISINVEKPLDQGIKHQRHLTAAPCRLLLLQEVHEPVSDGELSNANVFMHAKRRWQNGGGAPPWQKPQGGGGATANI